MNICISSNCFLNALQKEKKLETIFLHIINMVNKFNEVQWNKNIFNFIKRPIITDKTLKLVEQKKYVFDVNLQLTKKQIKKIFEEYYQNPVKSIKTFRKNKKKNPNKRVILRFFKEISIFKN